MKRTKMFGGTAALAALLLVASFGGGAAAADEPEQNDSRTPTATRVDVPLASHQRLEDAAQISTAAGYPVTAFRFENDDIVGEYSLSTGVSVEQYLADFQERYGTQPEVTHAVVEMPVNAAKQFYEGAATSRGLSSQAIDVQSPEFDAPPVDPARVDLLLEQHRERTGVDVQGADDQSRAILAPTRWDPEQADIMIFRPNSSIVYFQQYYYWNGGESATWAMSSDDGWEAEVNIYTAASSYQSGGRPNCPSDYKSRPFAKNYGWTWAALVNIGSGMQSMNAPVGAYADYNDLSDPCNRNSMAIGFRSPQNIGAYPSGMQEVMVTIQAPRGLDNSGRISGLIQPVNGTGCALQPWLSNTDCMGLTTSSYSPRYTLGEQRNWTAPNRCWMSPNYGNATPTTYPC